MAMKTVIITGASGNLGVSVTQLFLERDYRVIATLSSDKGRSALGSHPNLVFEIVNLEQEEETAAFVEKVIERYGVIDAALLLVGGFTMGGLPDTTGETLQRQIHLNFETAFYITRPLFEHLLKNKEGNIIFIGARPALNPVQGKNLMAYALSKSLLFKLAELLNETAKGTNVRVSVVVPSTLDTPLNRQSMPDVNPADWVKPAQIAETLEMLVSDRSISYRETIIKMYMNA
jgi:NAD(P)-dependent dehydrogenase (short-subunit alcohol dehydrogenase family)